MEAENGDTGGPVVLPIAALTPDDKNANKGTPAGAAMIEDSLARYGAGRSILLDKNGRVIAGNKTLEAAAAIGMEEVLIVRHDGKRLVAVQRDDIDLDTHEGRELAVADNKASEVSLNWDGAVLADLDRQGAEVARFFEPDEWVDITGPYLDADDDHTEEDADPDELPAKSAARVRAGDLWEVGEHRLLCDDATAPSALPRLMGEGRFRLLFADPPPLDFEVRGQGADGRRGGVASAREAALLLGTALDLAAPFAAERAALFALLPNGLSCFAYAQAVIDSPFRVRQQLCWVRSHHLFAPGKDRFGERHNLLLAGDNAGEGPPDLPEVLPTVRGRSFQAVLYGETLGGSYFADDATATTVLEFEHPERDARFPDARPVALLCRLIELTTAPNDAVLDLFSGSGAAMAACQVSGRKCRMVEADPDACDGILSRFEKLTGKEPRLLARL